MKEETEFKPKPLVEIGGRPILWHIMKIYAHYGFNEFILALGYKGDMIKDYFLKSKYFASDFTLHTASSSVDFHADDHDDFKITFADTGAETLTGERLLRVKKYIPEKEFMVTYGDGVGDVDLKKLLEFHRAQGTTATLTGVRPRSRFGLMKIDEGKSLASGFAQKPQLEDYISGGFMVFKQKAFNYFDEGWLENAFEKLTAQKELSVYKHDGFWKAMDTYNEMEELNEIWKESRPWAEWERKA